MIEIFNCDQGTPEWYAARAGIPTASKFAAILAKGEGKTRSEYMRKLAGEIITGEPMDTFSSAHMERGKEMEDEARELYAFMKNVDPERVGFIRSGDKGASPDSLIGTNGGLEIKTALAHIQIERLFRDDVPPEHKAQVQGNLWIAEREWWDFMSYWPKMPPFIVRVYRDDAYLSTLAKGVQAFNEELAEMVERIRHYSEPDKLRGDLIKSNKKEAA